MSALPALLPMYQQMRWDLSAVTPAAHQLKAGHAWWLSTRLQYALCQQAVDGCSCLQAVSSLHSEQNNCLLVCICTETYSESPAWLFVQSADQHHTSCCGCVLYGLRSMLVHDAHTLMLAFDEIPCWESTSCKKTPALQFSHTLRLTTTKPLSLTQEARQSGIGCALQISRSQLDLLAPLVTHLHTAVATCTRESSQNRDIACPLLRRQ